MCLIKIRRDEEEDEYVPYRRVVRRERIRTLSPRRSSKVVVIPPRERPLVVPPPQPVPLFVNPPPPAPVIGAPHTETHYVHVSPRSSASDERRSDDYVYRREVRREYSPARSRSRGGDYYDYRHVGAPRSRSRSRRRYDDEYDDEYDDDRRETVRVSSRRAYRD